MQIKLHPEVRSPSPIRSVAAWLADRLFAPVVALALVCAVAFGASLLQAGCTQVKHAGQAVVDCAKADQGKLLADASALWCDVVGGSSCKSTSPKSWSATLSDAESLAITDGEDIAGCALASIVEQFLAPPVGRTAPDPEAGRSARAALEQFRTKHGGVTYRTASGDL